MQLSGGVKREQAARPFDKSRCCTQLKASVYDRIVIETRLKPCLDDILADDRR